MGASGSPTQRTEARARSDDIGKVSRGTSRAKVPMSPRGRSRFEPDDRFRSLDVGRVVVKAKGVLKWDGDRNTKTLTAPPAMGSTRHSCASAAVAVHYANANRKPGKATHMPPYSVGTGRQKREFRINVELT
jgi:hypothetical protein